MAYIYRYTDLVDNIIKYVGIVWSDNRSLEDRLYEHELRDDWCRTRKWKIEYLTENITTRTDAEYFEAHYISLYQTDKYFNVSKAGWGVSSFLPNRENDWVEFIQKPITLKQNLSDLRLTIMEEKRKLNKLQFEIEDKNKELDKLACNINYCLDSSNNFTLNSSELIKRLDEKRATYEDFQYGITSKSSINKWIYREEGIRAAISIVKEYLLDMKCAV